MDTAQDPGAWILPLALLSTNVPSRRLAASQTDTQEFCCTTLSGTFRTEPVNEVLLGQHIS